MHTKIKVSLVIILSLTLISCDNPINNPHKENATHKSIYHASFSEQPKTLDPARSYSANEALFTAQIYEPPLQYDYLKRPYELIPLTAVSLPTVRKFNAKHQEISEKSSTKVPSYSVYTITIKPGIYFQPHPAFAKSANGSFLYHTLNKNALKNINAIMDFSDPKFLNQRRELTAADYVYQIKRIADPRVESPIYGLMSNYIIGLEALNNTLKKNSTTLMFKNLNDFQLTGVKQIDRYTYEITIRGDYPQFMYWLAMPFFSAMPWEANAFYSQKNLRDLNITLDWFPVGTGAYMMTKNNPNSEIILKKNPNFHKDYYPSTHELLPFIDEFHFSLEKESIPRWSKFLQGYYDASSIGSDNFDQAITLDPHGHPYLTDELLKKHLKLKTVINPAIYYVGFNMLDPVVGGDSEAAQKLRQAISIIINFEEYISIFLNGQGVVAQNPVPFGIFGFSKVNENFDRYVYNIENGKVKRKTIAEAKKLLAEAGYADGIDQKTQRPLILYFDAPLGNGPDSSALYAWFHKQFSKLGIQLDIRATQYNRFQEKLRTGNTQIFMLGWLADYPDPENFLSLLYGPNGKVKYGGENAVNYQNPEYDKLFVKMKVLPNGVERQYIINKMIAIVQKEAPWSFGYFPRSYQLTQEWVSNDIPNAVANNTLKYINLNTKLRDKKIKDWNKAMIWPILIIVMLLFLSIVPFVVRYRYKLYKEIRKVK